MMNRLKNPIYKYLASLLFILVGQPLFAQGTFFSGDNSTNVLYLVLFIVFTVLMLILIVLVFLLQMLWHMVREHEKKAAEASPETAAQPSWWASFITKANDAVPVEKEASVMLNHNYDGIKELDNHLPPWWKWLFYGTVGFAGVYLIAFHVIGALPLSEAEYQMAMNKAEKEMAARMANMPKSDIDESNLTLVTDPGLLAKGKRLYNNNCAACHKESGAGGIGPNLTDEYWLHGGGLQDIYKTIKYGVPDKGMIAWEPMFSAQQMHHIASYVVTLVGTSPDNPKAPQGELYQEKVDGSDGPSSDTTNVAVLSE